MIKKEQSNNWSTYLLSAKSKQQHIMEKYYEINQVAFQLFCWHDENT